MKSAKTALNFDYFFVDLQHHNAFVHLRRGEEVIKRYEKNEPNYFKTTKEALANNIDKINPKHLSSEDICNLHRDLTSHFPARPDIQQERTFGLNRVSCNASGIKEFIDSGLAGEGFLEFDLLNDSCLYQIKSDKKITRSIPCLTLQRSKYENIGEGQINLVAVQNEVFPSELSWQELVNKNGKAKFSNSSRSNLPRVEENFLLLDFDKLDAESKSFISHHPDVNLENVGHKIYENLCKPTQLHGLEFNLNINKSPEETKAELSSILEEYNNSINERWSEFQNDATGNEVVGPIGTAMKKISQLHPFTDGNARTTFILSNIILIKLGLEPFYPEVQSIFDMNSDDEILKRITAGRADFKNRFTMPETMAYMKPTTITESMYASLLQNNANPNSVTILSEAADAKTKKITCRKDEFNKVFAKVRFCQNTKDLFDGLGVNQEQYHLAESENYCVIPRSIAPYLDTKDGVMLVKEGKEDLLNSAIQKTASTVPQPVSHNQLSGRERQL